MYYFIPAWYGHTRPWHSDITAWHAMSDKIEFDDTINQVRVFQDTKTPAKLMILQYFPQLRYFLHRQDIFETPHIRIFDLIQQIPKDITVRMIDLDDLEWSDDVEFIYTPFLVMVYEKGNQTATISYGTDGNIISVVTLSNREREKEYIFDDRGFISSIVFYSQNQPTHQDYLTYDGEWVVREYLGDEKKVIVNPLYTSFFKQQEYDKMETLVFEKYADIEATFQNDDTLVIASSDYHNTKIISNRKNQFKTVFSFFSNRTNIENTLDTRVWSYTADLIITDSNKIKEELIALDAFFVDKIHRISSFDTRLQLGSSQQLKESKIYFFINSHSDLKSREIRKILEIAEQDKNINIVFALYNANGFEMATIEEKIEQIIQDNFDMESFEIKDDEAPKEDDELIENPLPKAPPVYRYSVKNFNNEIGVIRELEFTRLIVDLSEEPDLYTQIAGISAGIPQINCVESEYVEHLKNGYILSDLSELENATEYYLKTLKPWNESLVYSVDKIRENTGYRMIQKWEEWLGKL